MLTPVRLILWKYHPVTSLSANQETVHRLIGHLITLTPNVAFRNPSMKALGSLYLLSMNGTFSLLGSCWTSYNKHCTLHYLKSGVKLGSTHRVRGPKLGLVTRSRTGLHSPLTYHYTCHHASHHRAQTMCIRPITSSAIFTEVSSFVSSQNVNCLVICLMNTEPF